MQRIVSIISVFVAALLITGCAEKKSETTDSAAFNPVEYRDPYAVSYDAEVTPTEPVATQQYAEVVEPAPVEEPPAYVPAARVTSHVVTKGDSLYSLARLYYNDQAKWREIYNANRSVLAHPDKIYVGQELRIP